MGLAFLGLWEGRAGTAAETPSPLEQAASLRSAGRLDEALDVLRGASREIKRAEGESAPALLDINELAADILVDQGSLETADTLLSRTLSASRERLTGSRHEQDACIARLLLTLSRLRMAQKQFPDAVDAARQALTLSDQAAGPRSLQVARSRDALRSAVAALDTLLGPADTATLAARDAAAQMFASLGMLADAVEQRSGILAALSADGTTDAAPLTADRDALPAARERLCRLLSLAGRGDEAIALLEARLGTVAAGTPAAIADLRLLSEAQIATDRLLAANASLKNVLDAGGAGAAVPSVAVSVDRLRGLLVAVRRGTVAALPDWFAPAVKVLKKPPATEAGTAIGGLLVAADILQEMGRRAEAVEALVTALAIVGAARPPLPERIADVSARLAGVHLSAGDATAARKVAEPALAAADKALGPGEARVVFLRVLLADALLRAGDDGQATALAELALDRDLPRPDGRWEELVTAIYDRLPPPRDGAGWPERYVAVRARQFGADHPHVGMAWSLFGAARLAAGDWRAAVGCLARGLAVQQARLGDDHPEVAATRTLLAHAERSSGDPARSAATAARAVADWEKAAGPDHPGTLEAIDVLVTSRLQAGDTQEVVPLLERLCAAESVFDPVLRAGHLVRRADLTAATDADGAAKSLRTALNLACWSPAAELPPVARQRLAVTAARAAHAYRLIGDADASREALRRARSLAMKMESPAALLDQLERIAAGTASPPPAE